MVTTSQPARRRVAREVSANDEEWDLSEASKRDRASAWYPIVLGVFLVVMLVAALCQNPQSGQHQWLSLTGQPPPKQSSQQQSNGAATPGGEKPATRKEDAPRQPAKLSSTTRVKCLTTAGPLQMVIRRDWAPLGAARFLEMVESGFFESRVGLFRAVENFICQTGIAGDPGVQRRWQSPLRDDPQWLDMRTPRPMKRGYLAFAGSGPHSRTTEFFFAFKDIQLGGSPWEVPFGHLEGDESFETLDRFYVGYGDVPAFGGRAPNQNKIYNRGRAYLEAEFPQLDFIDRCDIVFADDGGGDGSRNNGGSSSGGGSSGLLGAAVAS